MQDPFHQQELRAVRDDFEAWTNTLDGGVLDPRAMTYIIEMLSVGFKLLGECVEQLAEEHSSAAAWKALPDDKLADYLLKHETITDAMWAERAGRHSRRKRPELIVFAKRGVQAQYHVSGG